MVFSNVGTYMFLYACEWRKKCLKHKNNTYEHYTDISRYAELCFKAMNDTVFKSKTEKIAVSI